MKDISQHQVDKRLDSVEQAVKRSRSAFLLCILVPGAMLLCLWNTYASWDRDFAFLTDTRYLPPLFDKPLSDKDRKQVDPEQVGGIIKKMFEEKKKATPKTTFLFSEDGKSETPEGIIKAAWDNYTNMLPPSIQDDQMRSWIETQVVAVNLLGIKISVSDFAIVGSLALLLCNFYSLLSLRRENHEIGYLFQDLYAPRTNMENFGYHAFAIVSSFMVFNLSGIHAFGPRTDGPIKFLEKSLNQSKEIPLIRPMSYLLDFLPTMTILLTIGCDFGWTHTTFFPGGAHQLFVSAFRPQIGQLPPYETFGSGERHYFWFAEIFAFIAAAAAVLMTSLMKAYESGTRKLLEEVYTVLRSEHGLEPEWHENNKPQEMGSTEEPAAADSAGASK